MINNSDNQSSPLNCLNYTHIYTHILPKKEQLHTMCTVLFCYIIFSFSGNKTVIR